MGTVLGLMLLIGCAWLLLAVVGSLTVGRSLSSAEEEQRRQERLRQHRARASLPR